MRSFIWKSLKIIGLLIAWACGAYGLVALLQTVFVKGDWALPCLFILAGFAVTSGYQLATTGQIRLSRTKAWRPKWSQSPPPPPTKPAS